MRLSLISPEKTLFEGDADMITVPGTEGEFGVLTGHAPFISTLKPGVITIDQGSNTLKLAVVAGIAEVTPERCIILAEAALDCTNQTQSSAQAAVEAARKQLEDAITDSQKKSAEQALALAEAATLTASI